MVVERRLPVFHQERTINKYLYQSSLPQMKEFTTCFQLKTAQENGISDDYIVSVATPGNYLFKFIF